MNIESGPSIKGYSGREYAVRIKRGDDAVIRPAGNGPIRHGVDTVPDLPPLVRVIGEPNVVQETRIDVEQLLGLRVGDWDKEPASEKECQGTDADLVGLPHFLPFSAGAARLHERPLPSFTILLVLVPLGNAGLLELL